MAKTVRMRESHRTMGSTVAPLFVILIIVTSSVSVTGAPPLIKGASCPLAHEIEPCVCRPTDVIHLTCWGTNTKRLIEILASFDEEKNLIKSIKIRDSHLLSIPDDTFTGLAIDQLILVNSNVSTIGDKAFADLGESLQELILDGNRLKEIPTDALSHLHSLKQLHLSNNKIEKLENYAFSKLQSLEELHLDSNDIAQVDSLAFQDCCRNLDVLTLAHNLLTTIPAEAFSPLTNITVLKLDNNNIKSVNKGAFAGLTQLNTIDISDNQISTVEDEAFTSCSTHSLLLKKNKMTKLSGLALKGLESTTEWLDISYNNFDKIPTQALSNFTVLRHLDMSHNKVAQVEDDSMVPFGQNLRYIELNNNNMQYISPKALQELKSVEFLMLAHNNLTKMSNESVQSILDTVFMLDLSDNPLVCGCELEWLRDWLDSVNPLDRLTPDPTCFIQGTKHLQYVRQLACNRDSGKLASYNSRLCLDLECAKSLASFFSDRIRWY